MGPVTSLRKAILIRRALFPALAAVLLTYTACKPGLLGPTKHYYQVDYAHGGTVTGVVRFTGTPPRRVMIDMAQDPICAMSPTDLTDDYVVHDGDLANVVVYIQSGLGDRSYPIPRRTVVIDQKGCRFLPHVSAAMAGQEVEFTNSDPTQHNVHMAPTGKGNPNFDVTQRGDANPISRYFATPELMMPVRCNNHPWMHAYLSVLDNPFFAVTGPDGRFTINGLPPGTYTLTALHEKAGSRSVTVRVEAGETVHPSFSF